MVSELSERMTEKARYVESVVRGNTMDGTVEKDTALKNLDDLLSCVVSLEQDVSKRDNQLKYERERIAASSVFVQELESDAGIDSLRECIKGIANAIGEKNPFLEDISDELNEAEDLYSKLDDIRYALDSVQSELDKVIGDFYDYQDGNLDDDAQDLRDNFESVKDNWSSLIDFAENWY